MSAALAEDLRHLAVDPAVDPSAHPTVDLAVDLAANDSCASLPPIDRCTAPAVPTSQGPRDTTTSCLDRAPSGPQLVPSAAQDAPQPPRCPEVVAVGKEGSHYAGNLLHDVVLYRSLRARQMQRGSLSAGDLDTLARLESALRPEAVTVRDDGRATRQFLRWETNAIAGVTLQTSSTDETPGLPVDTVDLGAGGICVVTELTLNPGDQITVRVAAGDDGKTTLSMASRVAWSRGRRVLLMFAGGPAWG